MISIDKVERYKKLYLKHYGIVLNNEQATDGLLHLIEAVRLAMPSGINLTRKDPIDNPLKGGI